MPLLQGFLTHRPTGVSVMKTHYRPSQFSNGKDPLPRLANRSDRDTGFTNASKSQPEFLHRVMGDVSIENLDLQVRLTV